MKVHLTMESSNVKTGPIPVSTSPAATCPDVCPLKANGCYAASGPLGLHWRKVSNGSNPNLMTWNKFCTAVAGMTDGQLWRHNQAGDLPGDNGTINKGMLLDLVAANKGRRGFTYTHKPMDSELNRDLVRFSNLNGFTINLSGNNAAHADRLADLQLGPVVTLLPESAPVVSYTPKGRKVVVCPAQTKDNVTCERCALCAKADRTFIIGFLAHGTQKKKAADIAAG